jgi:hypothetical protein
VIFKNFKRKQRREIMLRGDIVKLSEMCGCSKSTIYSVAEKLGIDLHPIHYRCDKTVDFVSGKTLADEQKEWLDNVAGNIIEYRKEKKERTRLKKSKEKMPEQLQIA